MARSILVTGGAGYVGSVLVPKLLAAGHRVSVLDLYLFGEQVFDGIAERSDLREIKGDIRDPAAIQDALTSCDTVIHLACISNDPSFELDPTLGESINHHAFLPLVRAAKARGVGRFIYASSSSVYGIKSEPEVTEALSLEPLTDYSRFKAICERELEAERAPGFTTIIVRPATVCGYGPRQRLDVVVNIMTNHAVHNGKILVFGGGQLRPNLHIADMAEVYLHLLDAEDRLVDGKIFNAGYDNFSLDEIAELVRSEIGNSVAIETVPTDDLRSYHISSRKLAEETGFRPRWTVANAIADLAGAFAAGKLPDSMDDPRYFNIKLMQTRNPLRDAV